MVALIPSSVATFPYFFKANESKSPAIKCLLTKCEAISKLAVNSAFYKIQQINERHSRVTLEISHFNGSLAGCSVQLQFEFLWGDELWPGFPRSYATSKWPIEAIASLKQVSVKRGLRSANSRLSVKSLQSSFYILHSVCILPLVRTLRFTLTVSQTLPESNWTHTDPVYLTFTWENLKFQFKKIKWFASIRLRSFLKKGLWFEATQFFYSF